MDLKNSKFIKIVAALLCCGLCVSSAVLGSIAVQKIPQINGQTAYADGHVYWLCNTDGLNITQIDESFFAPNGDKFFKYNEEAKDWLMPGGVKDGSITIGNSNDSIPATLRFYAESTGYMRWYSANNDEPPADWVPQEYKDFAEKNGTDYNPAQLYYLSKVLVKDKLQLKVYRVKPGSNDQKGRLIYQGKVNGEGNLYNDLEYSNVSDPDTWYNVDIPAKENENWDFTLDDDQEKTDNMTIYLGKIKPGETVKYIFRLHAPTSLKSVIEPTDPEYAGFKAVSPLSNSGSSPVNTGAAGGVSPVYNGAGDGAGSNEQIINNHGYSKAVAMIDWVFLASIVLPVEPPTEPSSTTTTTTQPETTTTTKAAPVVPGTGEAAIPYAVASGICGISALAIFIIAFGNTGRKKKEEE